MNLKNEIIKVISEIQFAENELAYLALTSKIENPLRDKIAFALHNKLHNKYLICRECQVKEGKKNRTDLAIFERESNTPRLLIEFKARSVPGYQPSYTKKFISDLKKMACVADDTTELYIIFFNNCIEEEIDNKFAKAVKYLKKTNKSIDGNISVKDKIDKSWSKHKEALPNCECERIIFDAGNYYDIPVAIIAYVYGPIIKGEL